MVLLAAWLIGCVFAFWDTRGEMLKSFEGAYMEFSAELQSLYYYSAKHLST